MQFIFGLGNPGKEYEHSRHNAGFMVLDLMCATYGFKDWGIDKKFDAQVSINGQVLFAKPLTFMNDSGRSVQSILHYYDKQHDSQLDELDHVFVVYDDLDMPLGQYKVQMGIHPKIHNGVNSIISTLHTERFWNVRIGTDTRDGQRDIPPDKYVLMPFNEQEKQLFDQVMRSVVKELNAKIVPPQPAF